MVCSYVRGAAGPGGHRLGIMFLAGRHQGVEPSDGVPLLLAGGQCETMHEASIGVLFLS